MTKRQPRKGANICPVCHDTMRVAFISKDVGGFTALPGFVGCPTCLDVRKVVYQDVEEVVTHRVVKTTMIEKELENVDVPQA